VKDKYKKSVTGKPTMRVYVRGSLTLMDRGKGIERGKQAGKGKSAKGRKE